MSRVDFSVCCAGTVKNQKVMAFRITQPATIPQRIQCRSDRKLWHALGVISAFIADMRLCNDDTAHSFMRLGKAPKAAFSGVSTTRLVVFCWGYQAACGLAGMFEVSGPSGQITIDFNSGYGFTAIIVAFLGRLHPWELLAGLLMALTYIGGELAQLMLGLPETPSIVSGDAAVVPIGDGHLYQLSHSHRGK